ncbi:MAG: NAD(P)-dependent alcohol dehydrogenase [Polyangiales bacterium]
MTSTDALSMRAAVVTRYGAPDVLQVVQQPRPTPGPGEVLVRVRTSSVNSGDARMRALRVPDGMTLLMRLAVGWRGPRRPVLGADFAGEVAAVGAGVTTHQVGDPVMGFTGIRLGAHAEYLCVPAALAHPKPAALSWEDAAALLFGGTTAMHYLVHAAKVQPGERVLVIGASGAVGVAAVQVAARAGAVVTGVCGAANAAMVRSLGAADVIDYRVEDFTRRDARWDVVMDCVGATDYARCAHVLAPGGRLLRVVCGLGGIIAAPWQGRRAGHRVIAGVAAERPEDVRALIARAAAGEHRVVVDDVLPLDRIADAHARVDGGHKRGSLVLRLAESTG